MQGLTCADCKVYSLGKLKASFQEIQYDSQALNAICGIFYFKKKFYKNQNTKVKTQGVSTSTTIKHLLIKLLTQII